MKARLKSGRIVEGDIAALFVKIGLAEPLEDMLSASDVVLLIKNSKTIDEVKAFQNDPRKTVQTAFAKKIKELI